jgi:hypothetical protein
VVFHHPTPPQCGSASADDGAAQIRTRLADLVQSSRHLDETVLDEVFGLGVAAHEGLGEANHPGVLGRVQALEHSVSFCDRGGRRSHIPHHHSTASEEREVLQWSEYFLDERSESEPGPSIAIGACPNRCLTPIAT